MGDHERIVVQLQVDVAHDVSDGTIQISKPSIVHVSEDGGVEVVVLTGPLRIRGEHIHFNPVVELLQRAGQFFQRISLRSSLYDSTVVAGV